MFLATEKIKPLSVRFGSKTYFNILLKHVYVIWYVNIIMVFTLQGLKSKKKTKQNETCKQPIWIKSKQRIKWDGGGGFTLVA